MANKAVVLVMKGALSEAPQEFQERAKAAREEIEAVLTKYGDAGMFALGLAGAEHEPD